MEKRQFISIQALRGIAALMVVGYHAFKLMSPIGSTYENLAGGVDIFFVISGFVMMVSSQKLMNKKDGWKDFAWHRIIRIVPAYWIITTFKVVFAICLGKIGHDVWNIVASYLFIPSRDSIGEIRPVIAVGWTLSFEMFFYALFALALATHIRPLKITAPVFIIVAMLAFFRRDEWPAISFFLNVLPLEFVGGIIIGELALKNRKLPPPWAVILLVVSCVALLVLPSGPTLGAAQGVGRVTLRLFTWGVPAFLLVASAVSLESVTGPKIPVWLRAIGDASYSIYLTHGSILFLHGLTDRMVQIGPVAGTSLLVLICTIVGYGFYRIVEKPITKRLRQI